MYGEGKFLRNNKNAQSKSDNMKTKTVFTIGLIFTILNLIVAIVDVNISAIGGWLCSAVLFVGYIEIEKNDERQEDI